MGTESEELSAVATRNATYEDTANNCAILRDARVHEPDRVAYAPTAAAAKTCSILCDERHLHSKCFSLEQHRDWESDRCDRMMKVLTRLKRWWRWKAHDAGCRDQAVPLV